MQVSIEKNTIFFRKKLAFVPNDAPFSRKQKVLGKGVSGGRSPAPGVFRNAETGVLNPAPWAVDGKVFAADDWRKKKRRTALADNHPARGSEEK